MPGKRKYLKNDAGLYMCPECDYTAAKSSTLCMHLNKHDEKKQNKCKFCDKVFLQKQTLDKHLENFSGKGDHPSLRDRAAFECPDDSCSFSNPDKGNCRTHYMRIHVAKEVSDILERTADTILCKTCRSPFASLGAFYYHSIGCVSLPVADERHVLLEQLS